MTQGFQITRAGLDDAAAIALVNFTAWQETYRGIIENHFLDTVNLSTYLKRWENILSRNNPNEFAVVIKNNSGKVMGYCTGGKIREEVNRFEAEIYALYLLKEYHGKGLGGQLFAAGINCLNQIGFKSFCLCVLKQNPTIGFYRHYHPDFEGADVVHIGHEDYDDVVFGWNNFNRFING